MIKTIQGLALCAALSLTSQANAQGCFVDDLPKPVDAPQYDAKIRNLMAAHSPIEYRNSCGLLNSVDQQFFDAIRKTVGCQSSDVYMKFFGQYLEPQDNYVFAVTRVELRTDEAFETYCQIIEQVDLSLAVNADGTLNAAGMQTQAPLLQALQLHIAEWRIN